jgi:hypothetical protein
VIVGCAGSSDRSSSWISGSPPRTPLGALVLLPVASGPLGAHAPLRVGNALVRRKAGPKAKEGREFWSAVRRDAIVLVGSQFDDLIGGAR